MIEWSAYKGSGFDHFTVLRSASSFAVPVKVPPPAGVTVLDGSSTTDPAAGQYGDGSLGADGTAWYRVLALNASNRTIAASDALKVAGSAAKGLGPFTATPVAGGIEATWTPYSGSAACFSYYKVSWSATNPDPSYLGDNDGAMPFGDMGTGAGSVSLAAGSWYVRVEAILNTGANRFIIGRSEAVQVAVP